MAALSFPYMAFVMSGAPLAELLEMLPPYLELRARIFPEGGPAAALTWLFLHALISWTIIATLAWWWRLSRTRSGT